MGAIIAYFSKYIFRLIGKTEPTDEQNVKIKLVGLAVVLAAVILTVVFLR